MTPRPWSPQPEHSLSRTETEFDADELVTAVYKYSAEHVHKGVPSQVIQKKLIEAGVPRTIAETVLSKVQEAHSNALTEAGKKNMGIGAACFVGGVGVSALSYFMASGSGGGRWLIAAGAIVVGAVQFFRGVSQYFRI